MVGQAFHWFDPDPRAAGNGQGAAARRGPVPAVESRRRARSVGAGGAIGAGSGPDDRPAGAPAAAASDGQSAGSPDGSRVVPFSGFPAFSDPVLQEVSWTREQPIEDYIDLQHTYSYVIRASDQVRARLDMQVRAALDRHQPGADRVRVPVICQVWRSDRR